MKGLQFILLVLYISDWGNVGATEDPNPDCMSESSDSTGTVLSPNYPNSYPVNQTCSWKIHAQKDQRLTLTVNHFDLSVTNDDYLVISLAEANSTLEDLMEYFKGSTIPTIITSDQDEPDIHLNFSSFSMPHNNTGFNITWQPTEGCGGEFTEETGRIESPFYNSDYSIFDNCTWIIHAPEGFNKIYLHIDSYDLAVDEIIIVKDGADDESHWIDDFKGTDSNVDISSSGRDIRVEAYRFGNNTGFQGYRMTWSVIGCGGEFTEERGLIQSPNYNTTDVCTWIIHAPIEFKKIELHVYPFELPPGDFIRIKDGPHNSSSEIGTYNSVNPGFDLYSSSSVIRIEGHRNGGDYGYNGYNISWVAVQDCMFESSDSSGTVLSPNYPNAYPVNQTCSWKIHAQKDQRLTLTVNHFDLSVTGVDYLEVYETEANSLNDDRLLGLFQGSTIPTVITSDEDEPDIHLYFSSSSMPHINTGFNITWQRTEGCGGEITNETGLIESTFDNSKYSILDTCTWIIHVPEGFSKIYLHIDSYDLASGDTIYVKDGTDADSPSIKDFSGKGSNVDVSSSGRDIRVDALRHGNNTGFQGYRMTWGVTGSGSRTLLNPGFILITLCSWIGAKIIVKN